MSPITLNNIIKYATMKKITTVVHKISPRSITANTSVPLFERLTRLHPHMRQISHVSHVDPPGYEQPQLITIAA